MLSEVILLTKFTWFKILYIKTFAVLSVCKWLPFVVSVNKPSQIKMPNCIEKCVRKQNIMFMHERSQFCPEYFQFMKKLLNCNPVFTHGPQEKVVSLEFEKSHWWIVKKKYNYITEILVKKWFLRISDTRHGEPCNDQHRTSLQVSV